MKKLILKSICLLAAAAVAVPAVLAYSAESVSVNRTESGSASIPYFQGFDDQQSLDQFTVIDANNDGLSWEWNSDRVRVKWNSTLSMDDWLILPGMEFEGGMTYTFTMTATASSLPESVQVYYGSEPTAEAMTTQVAELMNFTGENQVMGYITVPETGSYYVGVHGCSDPDKLYLYVDNISVEKGMLGATPDRVTDISIMPAQAGALNATVSFTTPTLTYSGDALTSLTKVEVARNGEVVKTFENPATGETLSFEDTVPADGTYTYTFTPYNTYGTGREATASAYIGVELPSMPSAATITETAPGCVKVTWEPITEDIYGNPMLPSQVKYKVTDAQNSYIVYGQDIEGTELSIDNIVAENTQEMISLRVYGVTAKGVGQGVASETIPVGAPYSLPMNESFADGMQSYIFGSKTLNGNNINWQIRNDNAFTDMTSSDSDNGFLSCFSYTTDEKSLYFSGKVDLNGATHPGLSFKTYGLVNQEGVPSDNIIEIMVREAGADEWAVVKSGDVNTLCNGVENDWSNPIICDLSEYAGKIIQWGICVTVKGCGYTMFDEFKLAELLDHDLSAEKITAPTRVEPNVEYSINFNVFNGGSIEASDYTVVLTDGEGNELETLDGFAMQPGESVDYNFIRTFSPCDEERTYTYGAKIVWDADEKQDNNESDAINIDLVLSKLPAPSDLTASYSGSGKVHLDWTAPEIPETFAETVTENFENFDSFSLEGQNGWTFVDVDGVPVGAIGNVTIPGITPGTTPAGFFVFDASDSQYDESFGACSGNKYIANLYRRDNGQADDWAVSPVLSGNEQTIKFFARSFSRSYPERFEVYYSYDETGNPEDFVLEEGSTVEAVPQTWTEYSFTLPMGARRFAIRSFAVGAFMLMVDDVTMEIDPTAQNTVRAANYAVAGYNVYRDGVKINTEDVTATTYEDITAPIGLHVYHVTALFDNGKEGAVSNASTYTVGIGGAAAGTLAVSVEDNTIVIANADGLEVYVSSGNGMSIYHGVGDARVRVAEGIYIVKAGNEVAKVIVK